MRRKEALQQLNLGETVAEFDKDLRNYFVETETFRSVIHGRKDVVAGDKGTGKTALFQILLQRYTEIPELNQVEVVPAFNPVGDSVFQQLARGDLVLTEGQYRTVWKMYILSLGGNWLLKLYDGQWTPSMKKLDELLLRLGIRAQDDSPSTIFTLLMDVIKRFLTPKSVGIALSFDEGGMPVTTPQVEFSDPNSVPAEREVIGHSESLGLLNTALAEANISLWLAFDRLDEAFQGFPSAEVPALRALFRTYLDMVRAFDRINLKLFVRKDLFRRITQAEGGFVNLSHLDSQKVEIIWDDDDLLNLLIQRVKNNKEFMETANLENKTNEEIFNAIFPKQVDEGAKRPGTLKWMLTRIRDGQNVKPPRNLIELVKKAQEDQSRKEDRGEPKDYIPGDVLIEGESIKSALSRLSTERVVNQLLAESGNYKNLIEKFRDGKAEHNHESLGRTLELSPNDTRGAIRVLVDMGFLERVGETFKVPMLYRDGLNISQGKAFQADPLDGVQIDPTADEDFE